MTNEIMALLGTAADVCEIAVPEICQSGLDLQTEEQIVGLLSYALECMQQAAALAEGDTHNVVSINEGIEIVGAALAEHRAEVEAWREIEHLGVLARAMDEAQGATLH